MAGKGKPKTGGRSRGTPNKNVLAITEVLEAQDFDVMAEMISLCRSTDNEMIKAKILIHLTDFIYPKRKALEITGDNPFADKSLDELKQLVKDKLNE